MDPYSNEGDGKQMTGIRHGSRLDLSEEEAYALLNLCLASPARLDLASEQALKKLAHYCRSGFAMVPDNSVHAPRDVADPS